MYEIVLYLLGKAGINPGFLRIFDYITFRVMLAAATALIFELIFGHRIIVMLYRRRFRDTGGEFSSIEATSKRGTPTGGGVLFIWGTILAVLIWGRLTNRHLWIVLTAFAWFGMVGYLDDLQKTRFKSSLSGLSQLGKTFLQLAFIVPYALFFVYCVFPINPIPPEFRTDLFIPFVKHQALPFALDPWVFVCFIVFAFFSIVNAVNITDGLDGLLTGPSIMCLSLYGVFAYILGNAVLSKYLWFPYFPGAGEMAVFCGGLAGALFGFLWYNTYPAEVFMGDTGSLAIGGALGALAFQTRQELLFPIAGGVFVAMIASSLIQEKIGMRMGRRIFLRAPIHHGLILKGVAEPKVVIRFWIVSILLTLLAGISIKLR